MPCLAKHRPALVGLASTAPMAQRGVLAAENARTLSIKAVTQMKGAVERVGSQWFATMAARWFF